MGSSGSKPKRGSLPLLLEYFPGTNGSVLIINELPEARFIVHPSSYPDPGSGKALILDKENLQVVEGNLMEVPRPWPQQHKEG